MPVTRAGSHETYRTHTGSQEEAAGDPAAEGPRRREAATAASAAGLGCAGRPLERGRGATEAASPSKGGARPGMWAFGGMRCQALADHPPPPPRPSKDWAKFSFGPSADQKFSSAPSVPLKTQHRRGEGGWTHPPTTTTTTTTTTPLKRALRRRQHGRASDEDASCCSSVARTGAMVLTPSHPLAPPHTPGHPLPFSIRCCTGARVVDGAVTLQAGGRKCMESFSMGGGSSSLLSRQVAIQIVRLPGALHVRLESGCQSKGPGCPNCTACMRHYTARDTGRKDVLPVGSADIQVLMLYDPPASGRRPLQLNDSGTGDFSVQFVVVHAASSLVVWVIALGLLVCLFCCAVCSRAHARWIVGRPLPYQYYVKHQNGIVSLKHPRWASPWVQVGLATGLLLIVAGVVWHVVLHTLHHAETDSFPAHVIGFAISAVGLLLFVTVGLRAFREDEPHRCPTCHEPASSWRFLGVYIPRTGKPGHGEGGGPGAAGPVTLDKAHTRCVRCVACARPVVVDGWPDAPRHRPYHDACWRAQCSRLCARPEEVEAWCAAGRSDVEQAQMLAVSIRGGSRPTTAALLEAYPDLELLPLPGGAPTALHTAAAAGQLPALQMLLERRPDILTRPLPTQDDAALSRAHSLRITGLAPDQGRNDLYVPQPPLSYCGRPVYVGHTHGHYLYWYRPPSDDKAPQPEGWCLSDYLGSGAPKYRLCLGDHLDPAAQAPHALPGHFAAPATGAGADSRGFWQRVRERTRSAKPSPNKTTMKWLAHKKPRKHSAAADSDVNRSEPPEASAPHDFGQSVAVTKPPAGSDVTYLSPEDLELRCVPPVLSLLEAAASSGHEATVRHVLAAHKARHPAGLRWQHHLGDGLWVAYPSAVQQQIAQALARGVPRFTPREQHESVPVTLDLEAMQQLQGAVVQPLRWHLQTVVHYSAGDDAWAVTCDTADVRDWELAFVGPTSGALATAAPDKATLSLLFR